ncbi:MAG: DUF1592 domain-containing protein [Minicystis sp.]
MNPLRGAGRRALLVSALALLSGACGHKAEEEPPKSTPTSFVCDPAAIPDALPLRRMSRAQYTSTVQDLVRWADPADADAILGELSPRFAALPADTPKGPDKHFGAFTSLDQAIQQEHADGIYALANAAGASLTKQPERLAAVAGACATDAMDENDDDCLDNLIRTFGERALRRPITDADVTFYRKPAGQAPFAAADYADVLALIMAAPESFFFVESGDPKAKQSPIALSAYELATRISYHFWQTMPDDELFEKARSGALLEEKVYEAQVERAFNDPRTREALATFYAEWLHNATLDPLDARVGTPIYDAIRGDYAPGPDTTQHLHDEVVDAARYYTFDSPASFDDFFQSGKSFARTDDVASLYGVPAWDGTSEPPDAPGRVGLLTRPAYVATGSLESRPIMKGVFIRKAILCDTIAPPPGNAAANPPPLSDESSTREVVENLTGSGVCAGCHTTLINPLGFATENFDSLGRLRDMQLLFDEEGNVVGSVPVDTASVPAVSAGDSARSKGAADLTKLISESPKLHACFARQYFRFTFGRMEDLDKDACALADVKKALDGGAPLADVLRAVALTPGFKARSFQ